MITGLWVDTDALAVFVCWSLACWITGVGWAAYRAVGWVDRIRLWAATAAQDSAVNASLPAESAGHSERDNS